MLARIGPVAYRLQLPENARIRDVFHIGVLKPYRGTPPTETPTLPPLRNGRALEVPDKIMRTQLRCGVWFLLVKWLGFPEDDATWEPLIEFKLAFPDFQLEDELFVGAGSDVMVGQVYERRRKSG